MSWDLALSEHGDAIVSASNDLSGISGSDLIEQRMKLRLKLHRGEWEYDENDILGSQLYRIVNMSPAEAEQNVPVYVREALRDITEIAVDDVQVSQDSGSLTVVVVYHVLDDLGTAGQFTSQQIEISIPFGGSF